MATYKVIQDIEAEDKFLGPLTLKQFVFGAGGAFFAYLCFFAILKNFPLALIVFIPPMLIGFFLAVPWSKDQPTEVWVLAKLRFYVKPRKRIWDQAGMEELVTVTAPKKVEKHLTDNLSQTEVKSRLEALAQTIDSRGWAVKDLITANVYTPMQFDSDRLVSASTLPQEVPIMDTSTIPDVYDGSTPTSANFDRMIEQSTELRKAQNLEKLDRIRHGEPLENIIAPEVHFTPPVSATAQDYGMPEIDEKSLTEELKTRKAPDSIATAHMRTINPLSDDSGTTRNDYSSGHFLSDDPSIQPVSPDDTTSNSSSQDDNNSQTTAQDAQQNASKEPSPTSPSPAILEYAGNNDLNIATIARQAKKDMEGDANEVVVSLR